MSASRAGPLFDLCLLLLQFPPASSQAQSYQPFPQHQQNFNYGAWQFNGFQPGFSYNYNSFNTSGASGPGAQAPQHSSGAAANWNHQQWNNWNYYGSNSAAQQESSDSQASSYQRTLEYVQQQSSWSANN